MMGDKLKPDQERALSEFQRILKDEIPTEMYNDTILLTRFLIARDFNIRKAESMIKKNVRWKKEMQTDTILTDFKPPEVLTKYMSLKIFGFDKEGSPVCYVPAGRYDMRGIVKSTNKINFLKVLIQGTEKHMQLYVSQSKKLGKPVMQSIGIFDVADLSLTQITCTEGIQLFVKYIMTAQDNYPEFVKNIYVINASSYFTTIWPVIQNCLGKDQKKKFLIYGKDRWKEELLKVIDADTLPAFLGGNRTDPDGNPLCLSIVNHLFSPVPEKYFLVKDVSNFSLKPGVKSVEINRQDQISETIQVKESNSVINWEFLVKNYDVGFGILLEQADGSIEELIPVHKMATELEAHVGKYRCKKPGKHMIVFDNSYSWFHIKEVYYRIWVSNAEAI